MTILVTSDISPLSIDTLCSIIGYSYFLEQKQEQAQVSIHAPLTTLQQEILNICNIEVPQTFDSLNAESLKTIFINMSSLKQIPSQIPLHNILGIIGNSKPQYFEHIKDLDISNIHIEEEFSLSTLIVEKFKLTQTPISQSIASILLLGIILNSNGLEDQYTTNRDYVAIEYVEQFANIRKDQINALVNQL